MAEDTPVRRGRRLRDRLPVRLRHHWRPAASLGVGLAAMVVFLGDARISPYVTSSSRAEGDPITDDVRGSVDLYDTSVPHSIQLTYRQTEFDKMMKEFKKDGTKDYIEADLVVDGVYLNDVGIRLKGNSTLSSLRGGRGLPGGGRELPGAPQGAAAGGAPTAGAPGAGAGAQRGQGRPAGGGPGGMGGMVQYDLSPSRPEELPWLVKIDEYVEGRAYQGEREISLRPGSNGQVPLNEALSLTLTGKSGQKAERYGFTELKVNNRPAATRLMVEAPDTDYAADVGDGNGVLYKAKAGGSFEYRGEDPTEYETSFAQLDKKGSQDLEPVMRLIKWVNGASDEEFARDLGRYVDVDSLAAYLATQNLLLNFDDMAGPGKNYLLWYDLDTRKFSVLGWDYNLTFSGDAKAGPDDSVGMPGGGPGGAAGGTPGGTPGKAPEGMPDQPPEGMPDQAPQGMPEKAPEGMPGEAAGGGGGADAPAGRGGFMQHVLKTRFLGSDAFDAVYKKAYQRLYREFYGSGEADRQLKSLAEQVRATGAASKELDTALTKLTKTVTDRTRALAGDKEVTG
ncbi:CotH kinase family protein [Streptomyces sp. NPDC003703]|uniref:CotH kinase family protein n=1 Tax=Streptomyces sp. NPDC003283 TaxID=3364681 RepID=UPI0036CE5869